MHDSGLGAGPPRLCVVTTHPIQYIAPWFRELAQRTDCKLHVIYLRHLDGAAQGTGFGQAFAWDVPLLEGYSSESLDIPVGAQPSLSNMRRLWRALHRAAASTVLVTGWNEPLLIVAQLVARLQGRRLIVRGEANDLRQRGRLTRLAHRMLALLPHAYVTIGRSNRRFYESIGVASERLFGGAYFVESDRLLRMKDANRHKRAALREQRGFADSDFVVLFCGKHVAFKRPGLLIDAAAILRTRNRPVKLLFAGAGELTPELRESAARQAVPAHFEGFLNQTELWRAYLAADAFVLPSDTGETWGLVTNEALLFELPVVVASSVGCAEDLVVDGETGYTFSDGAQPLADALERLVMDRPGATRMGQNGCARVVANYGSANATAGLMQTLDTLQPVRR